MGVLGGAVLDLGWRDGELVVVEMGVEGGAQVREESRKPSARVVVGACVCTCVHACMCMYMCVHGGEEFVLTVSSLQEGVGGQICRDRAKLDHETS